MKLFQEVNETEAHRANDEMIMIKKIVWSKWSLYLILILEGSIKLTKEIQVILTTECERDN